MGKYVLGIESSCDDTGVAIIRDDGHICANMLASQYVEHEEFGGVVPEIAARAHLEQMDRLIIAAMKEADLDFKDLSAIAATCGPGLIGGVMVGMMAGKAIAAAHDLPFIAVNHLEAHLLTARLTNTVEMPYLCLLVSGGHTQILVAEDIDRYKRFGTTLDDALGEAFDKTAKMMGLPYPGGPHMQKLAQDYQARCAENGQDPNAIIAKYDLPLPLTHQKNLDFSFSGLKTAMRKHIDAIDSDIIEQHDAEELAYAFHQAVIKVLEKKLTRAIAMFKENYGDTLDAQNITPSLVVAGGVAANSYIRAALEDLTAAHNMTLIAPPVKLCSDNGAMIAWAGIERFKRGLVNELDFAARPRWPLDPDAEKRIGAGVKA
ncbi:MAG: tRNA (adenosine(37)-N6)-threonylcarbamoyltransferase complex transferase subunit TsaD [Pseudomonadota bacterium]|nr:tRNA (adenosine(37)-N6)-threonylcarbamoyltransferase complex transferase subunit TsaD [Pseudomonadota bacterium]MEC9235543.1 tRNA (adenosine(37)-N6)-threonylcarbamoyltransferase complex transferase subunit TsaD [Pseudomonadota bacterium]